MSDGQHVRPFLDELARRTGLRLTETHEDRLSRTLSALQDRTKAGSIDPVDLVDDTDLLDALLDAVSIDESYFFRHPEQLEFVRGHVLPRLLEERGPDHVLQLWSAGCADGEEPYSLAIILAEEGLLNRASVLATDLTIAALERARRASYSRWALRAPEMEERGALFRPVGNMYELASDVAGSVIFRRHNLLDPAYPEPAAGEGFDVIMCRNVLLHLDRNVIEAVVARLAAALAPGGWLITAPADPVPTHAGTADLEPIVVPGGGVLYRRQTATEGVEETGRQPPPPVEPRPRPQRTPPSHVTRRPIASAPGPRQDSPPTEDGRTRCERAQALLAAGQTGAAVAEALAAVFLAPDVPATHLTLGLAAERSGQHAVAARAFRHAAALLDGLPESTVVELTHGEMAGPLAELARAHALLAKEQHQ